MHIGLTQRVLFHRDRAYDSLEHSWYEYLQGHTLIPIPNRIPITLPDIDLLIITGGDDNTVRDHVEQHLVDHMIRKDLPVVGICHGCQLLTRYLGGRCVSVNGHNGEDHTVWSNGQLRTVNSYHNLRIERVPAGARVVAVTEDNVPEAWIAGKIAGIMWHPERMDQPWIPEEIQYLLDK